MSYFNDLSKRNLKDKVLFCLLKKKNYLLKISERTIENSVLTA